MKTLFYTKKGDDGKSFIDKKKISKDDLFFEFLGALDELNSFLGIIRALLSKEKRNIKIQKKNINEVIFELQEKIFKLQAEVAMEKFNYKKSFDGLNEEDIKYMEDLILYIDNVLPPLKNFVIPGATIFSAYFDYARALSRRTERIGVKIFKRKKKKFIFMFLNRLSSLLFALARYTNYTLDVKETYPSYK